MTGKVLGYKPDVIQKAKLEYSPLCKAFNKGPHETDKKEGLSKRLKNIEDKDEEQLKAIKDQGQKQLNAIEKQNKNKLKAIEKDEKIVYIRDGINKLFEIYPKLFNKRCINSLEVFARNEVIDYKNLSYKILFYNETNARSHEINFSKNFGTLYGLLKDLITSKIQ